PAGPGRGGCPARSRRSATPRAASPSRRRRSRRARGPPRRATESPRAGRRGRDVPWRLRALPAVGGAAECTRGAPAPRRARRRGGRVAGVRILVVDDDGPSRAILSRQLERLGHSVVTAPDGESAWKAFSDAPDLECVVTDWTMPGLSGPDLCRRIRAAE